MGIVLALLRIALVILIASLGWSHQPDLMWFVAGLAAAFLGGGSVVMALGSGQ